MSMILPLLLAAHAAAAPLTLRAGPQRARLVELYSSEGCSSCPPADAWVSGLRRHPRLWKDFVPVVFHVAYWDHLGWKDPLADPAHEKRQRAYAAAWGAESVYTPGFALDGREWRDWREGPPPALEGGGMLTVRAEDGAAHVRYGSEGEGPYVLYVARLGMGLETKVARGENRGSTLRHDFVVRGLSVTPLRKKGAVWTARAPLPAAAEPAGGPALAFWVVGPDGRPVQAVGAAD